ncbi:MAG: deoxyguanosinetriphosphate triphosphohydrolase [Lachnospirales bacterium]
MNLREQREELEEKILSPYASKSNKTKGRVFEEIPCDIRTNFQRDRDRIIHSKSFRRLMHKTQAFISPEGDHYRTRLTHTLEVSQIARTIARALNLNEDLTEAIALGHDLGHTPFGHLGEDDLARVVPGGFHHNIQSVRVVEKIEKNGRGLNLTWEVLDGILNHRGVGTPSTLEGKIVQISDKIAYINHDIDDAIRAGILTNEMLPQDCIEVLGNTHKGRIDFLIRDIITNSADKNDIIMTKDVKRAMYNLRGFMFDNVYNSGMLGMERNTYGRFLSILYNYYMDNFSELPEEFKKLYNNHKETEKQERVVADYIAGMTDRFARKLYSELGDKLKKYI